MTHIKKFLRPICIALTLFFAAGCDSSVQEEYSLAEEGMQPDVYSPLYEPYSEPDQTTPDSSDNTPIIIETFVSDMRCFTPMYDEQIEHDIPICLILAAQLFAELCELFAQDNGYLWGKHLHIPFIFLYPNTRDIVANQPDSLGILTRIGNVYVGTLPDQFPAIYSFPRIGDRQWAMRPWDFTIYSDEFSDHRMRGMVHMSFHVQQPLLFGFGSDSNNDHMNEKANRISIQLEINALLQALQSTSEERTNAIHHALAIRAERRQNMTPTRVRSENVFEFHEGIANYTDGIISGTSMEQILYSLEWDARSIRYNQSMAGIFGYRTGEMYGHLLDTTGVNWRDGISYGVDLGQLLKEALAITELPPFNEIDLTLYGYEDILVFETERVISHERMLEDIRASFIYETTLRIPSGFESGSMQLDPSRIHNIPGLGSVYGATVVVSGTFGSLRLYEGFFARYFDTRTSTFAGTVIATGIQKDGNVITAPGWVLQLNDGYGVRLEEGHYVLYRH